MAKLIYLTLMSLDGYIEDTEGGFDWAEPSEEAHTYINELMRPVGVFFYGRRMYEVMTAWETMPLAGQALYLQDFAQIWQSAEKIVYSSKLESVSTKNTRVERGFDPGAIRQMKSESGSDMAIGGSELAAAMFSNGLVDECHLFIAPVVVGGGKRALPTDQDMKLELMNEQRFDKKMAYLHYRVMH